MMHKPALMACRKSHSLTRLTRVAYSNVSISSLRPPCREGDNIHVIDTPSLIVDLEAFEKNCKKLKTAMLCFPGVNIRPHCKAHKTAEIAMLQQKLLSVEGVCCQKVSEAEAMAEGGVVDILVSNQVVASRKLQRLVGLASSGAKISLCVESLENVKAVAAEASRQGTQVGILIEINAGQNRCGLESPAEVASLGQAISCLDSVELLGIQAYHGGLQHIRKPDERAYRVEQVVEKARAAKVALIEKGLKCEVVTGGGSGTYKLEAASGVFTEVQPGSFCFGDADYAKNLQEGGSVGEWEQSLWVQTQVMSRSLARNMAIVDAGGKALSLDSGPPILPISYSDGIQVEYQSGGDEHGKLLWPEVYQLPSQLPAVGAILRLQPGHCDPTVNMYDWIVAYRKDIVEAVWPIRGRGPGY